MPSNRRWYANRWRWLCILGAVVFVGLLWSRVKPFVDRVKYEDTVLQSLTDRLGGEVRVNRGSGYWIGPWIFRVASLVDLPAMDADDVDDAAEILNRLETLEVVFVQRTGLDKSDEKRLRGLFVQDVMLSEDPSGVRRRWEVIRPRAR